MPPVWIAVAAAAGIYAGIRLIAKGIELQASARSAEAERSASSGARQDSTRDGRHPIDLGALEWDEAQGVYRPRAPTQH